MNFILVSLFSLLLGCCFLISLFRSILAFSPLRPLWNRFTSRPSSAPDFFTESALPLPSFDEFNGSPWTRRFSYNQLFYTGGVFKRSHHTTKTACACVASEVVESPCPSYVHFQPSPQTYRLVVVGHSLGAGTASLLSMLLKPTYPNLTCFAYSSPSVVRCARVYVYSCH